MFGLSNCDNPKKVVIIMRKWQNNVSSIENAVVYLFIAFVTQINIVLFAKPNIICLTFF